MQSRMSSLMIYPPGGALYPRFRAACQSVHPRVCLLYLTISCGSLEHDTCSEPLLQLLAKERAAAIAPVVAVQPQPDDVFQRWRHSQTAQRGLIEGTSAEVE